MQHTEGPAEGIGGEPAARDAVRVLFETLHEAVTGDEFDELVAVSARLRLELDSLRHEVQDILRSSDALTGAYGRAHLLPELHGARERFAESASVTLRYEGMAIYFLALLGFLLFYGLALIIVMRFRPEGLLPSKVGNDLWVDLFLATPIGISGDAADRGGGLGVRGPAAGGGDRAQL